MSVIDERGFLEKAPDKVSLILRTERGPLLSSNDGGFDQLNRRDRLCRVVGYLMCALKCDEDQLRKNFGLLQLHDHKGNLTSVWLSHDHFAIASKYVTEAWVGECEYSHLAVIFRESHVVIDVSV